MAESHTVVNVRDDVTDSAAEHGFSEVMAARFASGDLELTQSGISHHELKPGKRQPFGHRHGVQEEIYVVLSGSGRVNLDGEIVEVGEMDAVRVAPATARCFEAGEDGIEFLAFGARRQEDAAQDVEQLPGWWG